MADSTAPHPQFPNLFRPIKLGPMTLPHRAIMSAHGMGLGEGQEGVSDTLHNYVVARARGGAALLGTESAPVHSTSVGGALRIFLFQDDVIPSLARLAEAVHKAGSKLAITLWHGGHVPSFLAGHASVAPTPIPNMSREVPRALTRSEIRDMVKAYGAAARRCKQAGLDAVEVQTATSYLLGSFLSPAMNHRTDEYGGSRENRHRIVKDVVAAVRDAVGDSMAVGVRTSTSHHIPYAPVDYDLEESIAAMKALADTRLIDWVSILSGSRWAPDETIPPMDRARPQLRDEARRFRQELGIPIIMAGRIRSPAEAEQLIAEGCADVVAMARTWIAEPEWASKAQSGRVEEIRPCMSCNQACAAFVYAGSPGSCVLNPTSGREAELPPPKPSAKPRRVAVIGGGPGGMEAARVAALQGHQVALYEAGAELGGAMRLAANAPHRDEMRPAVAWWENEIRRLQVRVHLNSTITLDKLPEADAVIWAIGARPGSTAIWRLRPWLREGIPGTKDLPHGRDILAGRARAKGNVLVIDEEGGWPAVSLVETLALDPDITGITVATTERTWGEAALTMTRELGDMTQRIAAIRHLKLLPSTTVETVEGGIAHLRGGAKIGPFDVIVLSTGTMTDEVPEGVVSVGDCVAPRGIWAATLDAAKAARAL